MPKPSRNQDEIQDVKNRMLDAAIKLLAEEGFEKLSMRKIASRMKMTAANIYNYFSGKDDLYLYIQTRGFEVIYDRFAASSAGIKDPRERLEKAIIEYINFGMENPDWYSIIFSMNSPKYSDYRNMEIEPLAHLEKETGLKLLHFTQSIADEIFQNHDESSEESRFRALQLWTALHGFVSLRNSRVLQEVHRDMDRHMTLMVKDLMRPFAGESDEKK